MPLIKDLKNVKNEEITLLDVKRAEEIIARANAILGRPKTECNHWHGWRDIWPSTPYLFNTTNNPSLLINTGTTESLSLNTSLTTACASILK